VEDTFGTLTARSVHKVNEREIRNIEEVCNYRTSVAGYNSEQLDKWP
jgi:hypothetical protein